MAIISNIDGILQVNDDGTINIVGGVLAIDGTTFVDGSNSAVFASASVDSPTFVVDSVNHRVGIGTTAPSQKLDVRGNIYQPTGSYITWNNGDASIGAVSGYHLQFKTYTGTSLTEKLRITSTGSVGIGTTDPLQKLHVDGHIIVPNNSDFRSIDTGGNQRTLARINTANEAEFGSSLAGPIKFMGGSSWTERMRIHTDGNIGINTTTPAKTLEVNGRVRAATLDLGSDNMYLDESANGTYLRIQTTSGYTDIGANNASYSHFYTNRPAFYFNVPLDVGGNKVSSYDNDFLLTRAGSTTARLRITSGTTHSDQDFTVNGDATVTGNLTVSGTTTFINTTNLNVQDAVITLNSGSATPANDIGMVFQRYSSPTTTNYNPVLIWEESTDRFIFGATTELGADNDIGLSAQWMTVTGAGDVGIGTTNPLSKLDVRGQLLVNGATGNSGKADFAVDVGGQPAISILTGDNEVLIGDTADVNYNGKLTHDGSTFIFNGWDSNISFFSVAGASATAKDIIFSPQAAGGSAPERVRIKGDTGRVGIGTNAPNAKLHVYDLGAANGTASRTALFGNNTTGATSSYIYIGATTGTDWQLGKNVLGTSGRVNFDITDHSSNLALTINSSRQVGIGTATPTAHVHIRTPSGSSNYTNDIMIDRPTTSDYAGLGFATGSTLDWSIGQNSVGGLGIYENGAGATTRVIIKDGGDVGVGTTAPANKLHIYSTTATDGIRIEGNQTSGPALWLESSATSGKNLALISNNTSNADGAGLLQFWNATDGHTFATWGTTSGSQSRVYTNLAAMGDSTNSTLSGPGQLALKRANNNPYLSFHHSDGTRNGYIQSIAADDKLYFHDWGSVEFNSLTTNTTVQIRAQDTGLALLQVGQSTNGTQTTGAIEVNQDGLHGGGISYNGDGTPSFVSGETADHVTFYRMAAGTRYEVFHYPYSSNDVFFNGKVGVGTDAATYGDLQVYGDLAIGGDGSDAILRFIEGTNGWTIRHVAADNRLAMSNVLGGTDHFNITETGQVGIGITTMPASSTKAAIDGYVDLANSDSGRALRFYQGSTFRGGIGPGGWTGEGSGSSLGMYATGGDISFHHNNATPTIRISDEGHLGLERSDAIAGGSVTKGYPKIVYPNVHWSASGSSTGQIIIKLPGTVSNYDMCNIELTVYEYNSTAGSKIFIGAHNWGNTTAWYNYSVQVVGEFRHPVRLTRHGTNRYIVLGTPTTSWTYGMVSVARIHGATFYSSNIDWAGDWTISQDTSITAFDWDTGDLNTSGNWTLKTPGALKFATQNGDGMVMGRHNDNDIYLRSATSGAMGLLGLNNANQFRFQVYGDGTNYGFLDGAWASWDLQKVLNGKLYTNGNTTYYLQPESANALNTLGLYGATGSFTNALTIGNNDTEDFIKFRSDTTASGQQAAGTGISWTWNDSSVYADEWAAIRAIFPGSGDTHMTFSTKPTGSGAMAERMRIQNTGNIGIGTTNPSTQLHIYETGVADASINRMLLLDTQFNVSSIDSNDRVSIGFSASNASGGNQTRDAIIWAYDDQMWLNTTGDAATTYINSNFAIIDEGTYGSYLQGVSSIAFRGAGDTWTQAANHGIRSVDETGNWGDDMSVNSYHNITLRVDSNNNNSDGYVRFMNNSTGSAAYFYSGYTGSNYNTWMKDRVSINSGSWQPRSKLDLAEYQIEDDTSTGSIMLGIKNGDSGGTSNIVGPGIRWKPNWSSYTKHSAAILQVAEGNYFRSGLAFYTNGTADVTTDAVERMRIDKDGNVGIGISEPGYKLDVSDAARIAGVRAGRDFHIAGRAAVRLDASSTTYPADLLFGHTAAANETSWNGVHWAISSRAGSAGNKLYFYRGSGNPSVASEYVWMTADPVDGKVGIGNVSPSYKLDVGGDINCTGEFKKDGVNIISLQDAAPTGVLGNLWYETDTGIMYVYYDGFWVDIAPQPGSSSNLQLNSLGVGTAASGTTGAIRATNDITAYYSDARLKDFEGTIPNAVDKVKQLNGYYFRENSVAKSLGYDNDERQVGVSAQEVQAVLPEIVTEAPISDEYLTVKYEKLTPLLIEAIKEQQATIEKQQDQIDQLTELVNKLLGNN